jgi:hypothetical protein
MADFVAVLNKTIDGLGDRNTQDMRQRVYERAKKAVSDKLAAISPPPTEAQSARQFKLLDDAIVAVEASYAPPPVLEISPPKITAASSDPLADFLDSVEEDNVKPEVPTVLAGSVLQTSTFSAPSFPQSANMPSIAIDSSDPVLGMDAYEQLAIASTDAPRRSTRSGGISGLAFGILGLLVIGGAGYAGYLYKDQIQSYLGSSAEKVPVVATPEAKVEPAKEPAKEPETPAVASDVTPVKPAAETNLPKLTQRLNADGTEIEAGPGAKPADVGEGATVAAATTPATEAPAVSVPAAEVTPTAPATTEQTIAVGQKAIFYEEKTGTEQGTADQGAVVWSVVQDSPGLDQPPEPAIRGDVTVPEKGVKVRLTIKRNLDKSLPASHIIEMLFTSPPESAGGAIENVQRFAMKDTEQSPGNALVGVPANFGDGFFLIALTDEKSAIDTNLSLLSKQQWIDIPVAYGSGRRALLSFEKGIPGDKVFQEVIKYWESKAVTGG